MDAIGLSNLPRQLINKNVVNMILEGDEDSLWCLLKCLFDLHRNQNIIEEQPLDEKQKNFYLSHSSAVLSLPIEKKEEREVKFSNYI